MNAPTFFRGKFPVAYNCGAPVCEVVSLSEWVLNAERIAKALHEIQCVMEARIGDGITHERETVAAVNVRHARNLLRSAMLLVAEDADAGGVRVGLDGLRDVGVVSSGSHYDDFEVFCSNELAFLAGLFGSALHTHYLSAHPELLPNRHWMVMQALGCSFTHLLTATAEMTVADARKNER